MTANGSARFGGSFTQETIYLDDDLPINPLQGEKDLPESTDDPDIQDLITSLNGGRQTSLLEPPETTSLKCPEWSYRGRFLKGKVEEYEATLAAYANSEIDEKGNHVKALKECRTYASIRRDFATGDVMVFGDSCRDRWCPMCAGQKAAFAKDQTKIYVESLKAPKFLTLTLRHNRSDLKSQVEFLQERFRALRARAYWKRNVSGGIWFLQVKRGKNTGCWHPHLHILLDSNRMEQGNLSDLWNQVTFGSPILDIRYVRDQEAMVDYVARYTSRPAMLKDSPLADRTEIIEALFRKRMCGTFGNAKMVTLTPPKVEATGDWDYVGHYDDIVERAEYCPLSKAIMIAYNTGQALSDKVYIEFTGHEPGPVVHVVPPPKVDRQLYLDFYNTG